MPGFQYYRSTGGRLPTPFKRDYLLGKSLTGSTALFNGDLVALTSNATYSGLSPTTGVVRRLLAADRTANYQQTSNAGVLGVVYDNITTDANGVVNGNPLSGGTATGVIYGAPNEAATMPIDPSTGRSRVSVILADPGDIFIARININTTDFASGLTLAHQYDNTLMGIQYTTNGNQTIYSLSVNASAAPNIVLVLGPVETDPLYNVTVTGTGSFAGNTVNDASVGPKVYCQFLTSYCQALTGIIYSTN